MEFWLYDRWDNQQGALSDLSSAVHYWEAGGENSLTITSGTPMCEGDRVLWRDDTGAWHEHIVSNTTDTRENGVMECEAFCEDALNETFSDKVDEKRVVNGTSFEALTKVLEQTRWVPGTVSVTGNRTISFYHCSVGECLQDIAEAWGCEVYSSFDVNGDGVVTRKVNLVPAMGLRNTHKRFEYGKDLVNVKRTIDSTGVKTAMRGYGKGEQVGDDAWGRRLTFADINGGLDYVADAEALQMWGRPDGKGGKAHAFGTVIFNDCEDAAELKRLTQAELDKVKEPAVSYACSVVDLKAMGFDYEGVGVGDDVEVVDSGFTPTLRLSARVMSIKRNLLDKSESDVVIGNIRENISSRTSRMAAKINSIERRSGNWDVAAYTPGAYLQQVIDGLNEQFNAQGMSYTFTSFEQGTIWSSVPLDDQGKPKRTGGAAIQICSQGFRIASGTKADGSWNWRTFGTGKGFTADEITAGVIRGGSNYWNLDTGDMLFKQGGIRDTAEKNFWNLGTGEFSLTSSNGSVEGIHLKNGMLSINASRITAGIIKDSAARNTWNLDTGAFTTNSMTANNITANGLFECSNGVDMIRLSNGQVNGFENNVKIGKIDFSSLARNTSTGQLTKGLQITGKEHVRITTPQISASASSVESNVATICKTGTMQQDIVTEVHDNGNGTVGWHYGKFSIQFINGFCVMYAAV